jgi:hypothetical protein
LARVAVREAARTFEKLKAPRAIAAEILGKSRKA